MEKSTLLFRKILGNEQYLRLLLFTFKKLNEKKRLKINEIFEKIICNLQALLFIATQKAENIDTQDIEKSLKWKENKISRYILSENVIEFYKIYKKYIDDIVKFINRK